MNQIEFYFDCSDLISDFNFVDWLFVPRTDYFVTRCLFQLEILFKLRKFCDNLIQELRFYDVTHIKLISDKRSLWHSLKFNVSWQDQRIEIYYHFEGRIWKHNHNTTSFINWNDQFGDAINKASNLGFGHCEIIKSILL